MKARLSACARWGTECPLDHMLDIECHLWRAPQLRAISGGSTNSPDDPITVRAILEEIRDFLKGTDALNDVSMAVSAV